MQTGSSGLLSASDKAAADKALGGAVGFNEFSRPLSGGPDPATGKHVAGVYDKNRTLFEADLFGTNHSAARGEKIRAEESLKQELAALEAERKQRSAVSLLNPASIFTVVSRSIVDNLSGATDFIKAEEQRLESSIEALQSSDLDRIADRYDLKNMYDVQAITDPADRARYEGQLRAARQGSAPLSLNYDIAVRAGLDPSNQAAALAQLDKENPHLAAQIRARAGAVTLDGALAAMARKDTGAVAKFEQAKDFIPGLDSDDDYLQTGDVKQYTEHMKGLDHLFEGAEFVATLGVFKALGAVGEAFAVESGAAQAVAKARLALNSRTGAVTRWTSTALEATRLQGMASMQVASSG